MGGGWVVEQRSVWPDIVGLGQSACVDSTREENSVSRNIDLQTTVSIVYVGRQKTVVRTGYGVFELCKLVVFDSYCLSVKILRFPVELD
jgi:hypothetical protein